MPPAAPSPVRIAARRFCAAGMWSLRSRCCGELFGPRSVVIAHAAARLAAVATGFDPRGIAVPETYLNRHRAEYRRLLAGYVAGHQVDFFAQQLDAWAAGAKEADGIAKAA